MLTRNSFIQRVQAERAAAGDVVTRSFVDAYDAYRRAEQAMQDAVYADYPVGADVSWIRQKRNTGVVIQHGYLGKLYVRNILTGAEYWIRPDEIMAAMIADTIERLRAEVA